jgi:hypothetical protein
MAFSLLFFGTLSLCGYLLSKCCMNFLKGYFGNPEEGLSED